MIRSLKQLAKQLSQAETGSMKTLSMDLRLRILTAVDAGTSQSEAARRFAVSRSSVKRLLKQRREEGHVQPKPRPGLTPRIPPAQHALLASQMQAHPAASR